MPDASQSILDQIQPVVLVGGQSSRFGRDKLVEQVDGALMVSVPIYALRAVFGDRVGVVGRCDPVVAELGDLVIEDPYPGLGPVGGICAALEGADSDIFVCAGDLISIDQTAIRSVVQASIDEPGALAYIAHDGRRHPTVGLYRRGCVAYFQQATADENLKLGMVLDREMICHVPVDSALLRNVNHPDDLK